MTLSSRQWIVWIAAVGVSLLTAAAGVWQWRRAQAKQAMLDAHAQAEQQAPWGNADWPCQADATHVLPQERRAVLHGRWWTERTVYLDNRPMGGQVGFIVVTPLQLQAPMGACAGAVVLVERGWVPRDAADRRHVPALVPPGPVTVEVGGRVLAHVSRVFALGQEGLPATRGRTGDTPPLIRQNAGGAFWTQWLGVRPLPGALREEGASEATAQPGVVLSRQWDVAVSLSPDRHRAYAAQWFALSALAVGLTVWFQIIRPHMGVRHASP